jgi:hypothetical protein
MDEIAAIARTRCVNRMMEIDAVDYASLKLCFLHINHCISASLTYRGDRYVFKLS